MLYPYIVTQCNYRLNLIISIISILNLFNLLKIELPTFQNLKESSFYNGTPLSSITYIFFPFFTGNSTSWLAAINLLILYTVLCLLAPTVYSSQAYPISYPIILASFGPRFPTPAEHHTRQCVTLFRSLASLNFLTPAGTFYKLCI